MNPAQDLDQARKQGLSELASLPGLQAVSEQLARRIAVLQAEQARRRAGMAITRPAWKNLIFTGAPGCGKSRAAKAVARTYQELGLLSYPNVTEVTAADLASTTAHKAATILTRAENDHSPGNAWLAVRLLNEATASQALRVTTTSLPWDPAMLSTIQPADISGNLHPQDRQLTNARGQYL